MCDSRGDNHVGNPEKIYAAGATYITRWGYTYSQLKVGVSGEVCKCLDPSETMSLISSSLRARDEAEY
jgi:hypothetical protein